MALEVQSPPYDVGTADTAALDGVLRHHLRLEPPPQQGQWVSIQ